MLSHQPMHQNNNKTKTKCVMLKKYGSAYLHKFICNKKQHVASVWWLSFYGLNEENLYGNKIAKYERFI